MGVQHSEPCPCSRGVVRIVKGPKVDPNKACTLRIVQVTDVYMLDYFPSLRTLIREKRAELDSSHGGHTISMLTGDFLAPYLLSSLDRGAGMMKTLNATPIEYLTWGNHEDDVGHQAVMQREREYQGCWINTNMQSHESFKDSKCQKAYEIIEVKSRDGSNTRKIGLIGILSNSPSLYKPNAFGGAKIEDPWATMAEYKELLEKEHGCDLVIPLCHLYEPQDERTCREFDFPVILSGHDHHVVDRTVSGTLLLKPGCDALKAVMLDLTWPTDSSDHIPHMQHEILHVPDWKPDPVVEEVVEDAYAVLEPLKRTQLALVPDSYRPLTSLGARSRRVSMGTYMLSRIRDAVNMDDMLGGSHYCDCALLKGGNVRGGRDYKDDEHITLEVLQSELEETKEVVVVPVPGFVLHMGIRETFAQPNPGWLQYDDGVILDADGYVEAIGGEPLDPARMYRVASISDFWRRSDAPTIGAYFECHPELLPEPDAGFPMHALLLRLFAKQIWEQIWDKLDVEKSGEISATAFRKMDRDGDGFVSLSDLRESITDLTGLETCAGEDTIVNTMFEQAICFDREERRTLQGSPGRSPGKTPSERSVSLSQLNMAYSRSRSNSSIGSEVDPDSEADDEEDGREDPIMVLAAAQAKKNLMQMQAAHSEGSRERGRGSRATPSSTDADGNGDELEDTSGSDEVA